MKTSISDLNGADIHVILMVGFAFDSSTAKTAFQNQYKEVPDSWYQILLGLSVLATLSACSFGGFEMTWWAIALSLFFIMSTVLPLGAIEAISGQRIGGEIFYVFNGELKQENISQCCFRTHYWIYIAWQNYISHGIQDYLLQWNSTGLQLSRRLEGVFILFLSLKGRFNLTIALLFKKNSLPST
jgi:hypothetical protein